MKKRKYELRRRAERQAETRRRIVEAALALHGTVGANASTMTAIADRAGVSRPTVYRHFPDELSLLIACTTTYGAAHPPPDPATWASVEDPERRLGLVLTDLYAFYAENEPMLASGADALPTHPALRQALQPFLDAIHALQNVLAAGWPVDSGPGSLLAGALGHTVDFTTWRSLRHQQGLTNDQAVTLMVAMTTSARDAALARERRAESRGSAR